MFVLATAAIDTDSGEFLGCSAHLTEVEMHTYLRSAYDPEDHLAEVPNSELIEALADDLQVRVVVESRIVSPFHQEPEPEPVIVTDDGELKCPGCGHTGSMVRIYTETASEKVWLSTWSSTRTDATGKTVTATGRTLESKGIDIDGSESVYQCYECDLPLDFFAIE